MRKFFLVLLLLTFTAQAQKENNIAQEIAKATAAQTATCSLHYPRISTKSSACLISNSEASQIRKLIKTKYKITKVIIESRDVFSLNFTSKYGPYNLTVDREDGITHILIRSITDYKRAAELSHSYDIQKANEVIKSLVIDISADIVNCPDKKTDMLCAESILGREMIKSIFANNAKYEQETPWERYGSMIVSTANLDGSSYQISVGDLPNERTLIIFTPHD